MRVLVCGNGAQNPSIKLRDFSRVIRFHEWMGRGNPLHPWDHPYTWVMYPRAEYKLSDYLKAATDIWMPHHSMDRECKKVTGIKPSNTISIGEVQALWKEVDYQDPSSGIVILYMALLLREVEVYATGFSFYKDVGLAALPPHDLAKDEAWYIKQKKKGKINEL